MPVDRDDKDERAARIDAILEEARSKTETVRENVKRTNDTSEPRRQQAKAGVDPPGRSRPRKRSA
jgi:hypothetical protein